MDRFVVVWLWRVAIVLGLVAGLAVSSAGGAPVARCYRVPTPKLPLGNGLNGVAAVSPRDAWAVGYQRHFSPDAGSLIEHWDGQTWNVQPSPSPPGTYGSFLAGVTATSPRNAWAVGDANRRALIEHWDGRAWKLQAIPRPRQSQLVAVAATSPRNAWAVGTVDSHSLILHWNGTAWTVQARAKFVNVAFTALTATSTRDAWLVGQLRLGNANSSQVRPFIAHWDGKAWKVQPSPRNPLPFHPDRGDVGEVNELAGISAISSTNVWAVGNYAVTTVHGAVTASGGLIEHWNGRTWQLRKFPQYAGMTGIAASSSSGVWITINGGIGHWNGRAWTDLWTPGGLSGLAATPAGGIWAVGYDGSALALRCH